MITPNITTNHDLARISQTPHTSGPGLREIHTGKNAPASNGESDGWVKIDGKNFPFGKLQASNLSFNSAAKSIRIADRAMEKIESHINHMKDQLQTHVKNYPPFLSESEERVKMLKSMDAFRKLIDQLTFPPGDIAAGKIMSDPSLHESEDWDVVVEHNGFSNTILSRQVHTGHEGLDIPEFPKNATDDDIHLMIERLNASKEILRQRRSGLSEDASSILNPPEV